MNLTTEVKTNVIITFTKSHYFITDQQNERLKKLSLTDKIEINGNMVSIGNIAEIQTIEEYYKQHPEKEWQEPRNAFKENYGDIDLNKTINRPNAIKGIIRDLKQFIAEQEFKGVKPLKALELLEHIEGRDNKDIYQKLLNSF